MKDLQHASKLIVYQDNVRLEINLIYSTRAFFLKNKPQQGTYFAQFTGSFICIFFINVERSTSCASQNAIKLSVLKVDTSHFKTQNNVLCGVRNQRTGCAGQGDVNRAVVNHSYVRLLCCSQITNAVLLYQVLKQN